jgi:glycosyltransferase involved in cell wall biosynthesis
MRVLVIIPAYNEDSNIECVVDSLMNNYNQFDYIVVNDGSKDKTADLCRSRGYNFLDLPINVGLAGAFQAGMKYAYKHGYDAAIQFDGDGQHRPEYIEMMQNEISKGYDIVIGSRFLTNAKKFSLRMTGSFILGFAIRIVTGTKISDPTSGMRMYGQKMIKEYANNMNFGPEPDTLAYIMRKGAKVTEIQVSMDERLYGTSYLSFANSVMYMVRMILSIFLIQWFRK